MFWQDTNVVTFLVAITMSLAVLAPAGALDLGPEEIVEAKGVDIVVPGYSVPSFEDWNNDLLKDLIVGEGSPSLGKVRIYLNVGTEAEPQFDNFFYAQSGAFDLSCSPSGCLGCFPRVVYWDADDRKDLLVGQSDGTVMIFLNVGTDENPTFDYGTFLKVGAEDALTLDVGYRATPTPLDWNGDGLLDLVAGAYDGAIHIYYNCGCDGALPPHFCFSEPSGDYAQEDGLALVVPGGRSSPAVADLDGDGLNDLLVGNTYGEVLFYQNMAPGSMPVFSGYTFVTSNGVPIDLPGSSRSRPVVCHWTGDGHFGPKDGYWDVLVGSADGKIHLYRGIAKVGDFDADGDIDVDDLRLFVEAWRQPDPPANSPADLNADGILDYLDLEAFVDLMLAANPPAEPNTAE
ncbi:MAG: VCBS repeat-containing protein [Sedimentisphaerales bacterium]|nr:VCBS repeat-containing protein [Sedimentisphaerales bacterium]